MKEKETKSRTYNRKKLTLVFCVCVLMLVVFGILKLVFPVA